jgi:hypothetical protein
MGSFSTILYLFAILFSYFLVSVIVWNRVWLKRFGVEIPIDKTFDVAGLNRRRLFY